MIYLEKKIVPQPVSRLDDLGNKNCYGVIKKNILSVSYCSRLWILLLHKLQPTKAWLSLIYRLSFNVWILWAIKLTSSNNKNSNSKGNDDYDDDYDDDDDDNDNENVNDKLVIIYETVIKGFKSQKWFKLRMQVRLTHQSHWFELFKQTGIADCFRTLWSLNSNMNISG